MRKANQGQPPLLPEEAPAFYQLEWLIKEEGQPNTILQQGSFEDCFEVMLRLIQAAPHTPYITPILLYRVDGDGMKENVSVFTFGVSQMPDVELKLVQKEGYPK